jgi:proline iminopeptidase
MGSNKNNVIVTEQFVTMKDGANIFTVLYDGKFDRTLLMVHGGPGASCDYFRYQAELLSQHVNVVLFDERGVRRSDVIEPENFDFQVLIDDIDDIRKAFNIKKWSVLGHSFGGLLTLLYATKYQEDTESIIFECPSFCNADTSNYIIEAIKNKLHELENFTLDNELLKAKEGGISSLWDIMGKIPGHIITEIYHPFPRNDKAANMSFENAFTAEEEEKTKVHCDLVVRDSYANENHFHRLKHLSVPSLLLIGEYDVVCSPKQQEAFTKDVLKSKIVVLPNCGHTLHNEIPHLFVETVLDFLNS